MPAETVLQRRLEEEPVDEGPQHVLATGPLQAPVLRSVMLTGLFLLAIFHTLRVGRDLFLPLLLAFLLSFLLSPLLRMLKRARIPEAAGAALLLTLLVGGVGLGLYSLVTPATEWIARAPDSVTRIQGKLRSLRFPMEQMSRTADQVERTIAGDSRTAPVTTEKSPPWIKQALLGGTTAFVSEAIVVIVLLYFLLASGDLFLRKLIKVLPTFKDKKRAVEIAREIESNISTYLFTVTLINIGVGVAVAVGVWLLKMPNPVLWGVLACALTYVPYLGALVGIGVLSLAAMLVFDDLGHALAVPAVYMVVSFLEGNFITM
jgi:predicted PurR-regulated permease PerM